MSKHVTCVVMTPSVSTSFVRDILIGILTKRDPTLGAVLLLCRSSHLPNLQQMLRPLSNAGL